MNEIDIKQEPYCPITFRVFGYGLIVGGLTYIIPFSDEFSIINMLIGIGLSIVGLILATTHYGLIINLDNPSYTVYVWILGFKSGKPVKFNYIEKFYINAVTETASISNYSGARKDYSKQVYKAYMLLDTQEKIHVDTHRKEEVLLKKVEEYKKKAKPVHNSL